MATVAACWPVRNVLLCSTLKSCVTTELKDSYLKNKTNDGELHGIWVLFTIDGSVVHSKIVSCEKVTLSSTHRSRQPV